MAGALVPASAAASTQQIDAVIGTSVSMTTPPSGTVDLGTLPAIGAGTPTAAGSMVLTTNSILGATVTVQALKSTLTKVNTGTGVYTDSVSLASPITVLTSSSDLDALAVPAVVALSTAPVLIAAPLLPSTYTYSIQVSQPTLVTDAPGTYRNVLTYTASPVLP